ncbi:hypothetical protein QBC37DRAFT_451644 [Rhypophila decipiens]|uniref:Uncharacterized protein n=1 Tax=Rhypophila decipiens TaxID=261697 RepID=A0AAN7BAR9_9PEZI|nr:hypothetical protein QBC37DRAFT_451644 [Rhypophila decipiens]
MQLIIQTLTILISAAAVTPASMRCTAGRPWTKQELTEYQSLNSTDGWAGMDVIPHCVLDDTDHHPTTALLKARGGGKNLDINNLQARGGGNDWQAFGNYDSCHQPSLGGLNNFGCGACFTPAGGSVIRSGWLYREKLSGDYPTVDYYSGTGCTGSRVHHQGIYSGQHTSCDYFGDAYSAVVYQGC